MASKVTKKDKKPIQDDKSKNMGIEGFRFGAGAILGVIALVVLFFWLFSPRLEVSVQGTGVADPTLNTQFTVQSNNPTSPSGNFCPTVGDINITYSYGVPIIDIGQHQIEGYTFSGKSVSVCRNGSLQGENVNERYCPGILNKISGNGTVISQSMFTVEINPQTNQIISVSC